MVSYTIRRGCRLEALYDGDVGLAAALAHGLQAVATTGALELGEEGGHEPCPRGPEGVAERDGAAVDVHLREVDVELALPCEDDRRERLVDLHEIDVVHRSEEHTSELQSLMRISYAVFCLKKKTTHHTA